MSLPEILEAERLDAAIDALAAGLEITAGNGDSREETDAVAASFAAMVASFSGPPAGRADIRRAVLSSIRPRRRFYRAVVLAPIGAAMALSTVAVASVGALPGDPLYAVRRGIAAIRVAVTVGDDARAAALLDRAVGDLNDAEGLAEQGALQEAGTALEIFDRDLTHARAVIAVLAPESQISLHARAEALDVRAAILRDLLEGTDPSDDDQEPAEGPRTGGTDGDQDSSDDEPGESNESDDDDDSESSGSGSSGPGSASSGSGEGESEDAEDPEDAEELESLSGSDSSGPGSGGSEELESLSD